eukprot:9497929-Pyramimonas_sp.AAC.1
MKEQVRVCRCRRREGRRRASLRARSLVSERMSGPAEPATSRCVKRTCEKDTQSGNGFSKAPTLSLTLQSALVPRLRKTLTPPQKKCPWIASGGGGGQR